MATHPTAKSPERLKHELLIAAEDAGDLDLESFVQAINYQSDGNPVALPNVSLEPGTYSAHELRWLADWLDANATPEPTPRAPQRPAKPT